METRYARAASGIAAIVLAFGLTTTMAHEGPAAYPSPASADGSGELESTPDVAPEAAEEPGIDPRLTGGIHFGAGAAAITTPAGRGLLDPTPSVPGDRAVGASISTYVGYRTLRDNYVEFVLSGWFGTVDGDLGSEEWSLTVLGGAYRVYPFDRGPFLRLGFGVGFANVVLSTPEGDLEYDDYGFAAIGSLGWDTKLTDRAYVGPIVDAYYVDVGEGVSSLIVTAGLGISWR